MELGYLALSLGYPFTFFSIFHHSITQSNEDSKSRMSRSQSSGSCCTGCHFGSGECVKVMHVSCKSDKQKVDEMVGICLFSYQGKTEWILNNHHCKKGYILIKKTKKIEREKSTKGVVHGKLYKWFFKTEPDSSVVATGFSILKGQWTFRSGVFNKSEDREAFAKERDMIRKSVENFWRTGGVCQNCYF